MVNQYVNWKPRQAREHQVATSFVYLIGWVVDARIFNQSLSSVKENQELTGARKTENWAVSGAFEKWTPRKTVRQSAGKLANTSQVVILFFFFYFAFHFLFLRWRRILWKFNFLFFSDFYQGWLLHRWKKSWMILEYMSRKILLNKS